MTDDKQRAREARYKARNQQKGIRRVHVRVPEDRAAEIQQIAADMRAEQFTPSPASGD